MRQIQPDTPTFLRISCSAHRIRSYVEVSVIFEEEKVQCTCLDYSLCNSNTCRRAQSSLCLHIDIELKNNQSVHVLQQIAILVPRFTDFTAIRPQKSL